MAPPANHYRIVVGGHLPARWSPRLENLAVCHKGPHTILSGPLTDQAALYGLLLRLRDLGVVLLAVESRAPTALPDEPPRNSSSSTPAPAA